MSRHQVTAVPETTRPRFLRRPPRFGLMAAVRRPHMALDEQKDHAPFIAGSAHDLRRFTTF
jgi:hypothetical protein